MLSRTNNKKDQDVQLPRKRFLSVKYKVSAGECGKKATITTKNQKIKEYIGSTRGLFKKRWYAHISDIRNDKKKKRTFQVHLENKKKQ